MSFEWGGTIGVDKCLTWVDLRTSEDLVRTWRRLSAKMLS